MKLLKSILTPVIISSVVITFASCKAKKKPSTSLPPPEVVAKPAVEEKPAPATTPSAETASSASAESFAKANYNFKNIQFEFNSAVLKTFSYEVLDQIAAEMKKGNASRFEISGHSSAEGSDEHNKSLSVDRANAVKTYLVNAGVSAANLSTIGYGESKPLTQNTTEEGRALNRRVEIKKTN
jgi:OmpA-OmpF porin, OOP family